MQNILLSRIAYYKTQINNCLQNGDGTGAVKNHAIQVELEFINALIQNKCINDEYYTTQEVSDLLKISFSAVTRKALALKAEKDKGKWLYPKYIINEYLMKNTNAVKRGRKPKLLK